MSVGFGDRSMMAQSVAHLRSIRAIVWAVAMSVLALLLAGRPLFNLLGFEFAFAMAFIGSIASMDLAASFVRRARAHLLSGSSSAPAGPPGRVFVAVWGHAVLLNLGLLLAPLLIISLNGLRVRNCDWGFGLQAYLYMPLLSSALATTCGVLAAIAAGQRRILSNALPYAILFGAIVLAVWRFYSTPAVFNYNLFIGYFPGNLYDEHIAFRAPFYWARLYQLSVLCALACATVALLDPRRLTLDLDNVRSLGRLRPVAVAGWLAASVLALLLWTRSGALGFAVDAADIKAQLGGRYETANFVIYYERGGVIERDIELIADDHEFRYAQLVRDLGVDVPRKIVSFYFSDPDQKYELMGARHVYMAKPWRKEIYVHHQAFPHQVLRHEIAHVVAGEFGDPIFGVSARKIFGLPVYFNVGMIEGIAVAADWPNHFTGYLTPHQSVKAMLELKLAPPVHQIFSTGFMQFSSAKSYTLAGSFVRYLLDTYGAEKLRQLYRSGGDFQTTYGVSQRELIAAWRTLIDAITLPKDAAQIVRERFRRRSIFKRPCAHAIASKSQRVAELASQRDVRGAIRVQRSICQAVPREPRYQLTLAGLLRRADDNDEARQLFEEIAGDADHVSSSLRAEALLELSNIAAKQLDWGRVKGLLERARAMPLPPGLRRNVDARLMAINHTGKAGPALRAYFWPGDEAGQDPVLRTGLAAAIVAAEPNLAIGHYLLGRMTAGRALPELAAQSFERALDAGLNDPLLERECARMLAVSAYRARRYDAVKRAAAVLMKSDNQVMRLYGEDWLERVHWKQHGTLPR